MFTEGAELELVAAVPVAELARLRRRIAFLEAALVQLLRDDGGLKEWFSAAELAALRLPGLPASRGGIARVARDQRWETRQERGRGGDHKLYHFAALPRRAFAAFIDRVLRGGDPADAEAPAAMAPVAGDFPALAAPAPVPAPAVNATPAWVLPLLRLLRTGGGPLEHALAELPRYLTPGVPCPTLDDARAVLAQIGGTSAS